MNTSVTDTKRELINSQNKINKEKTVTSFGRTTDKNTPIVKPGSDMDKNAFLKILSAELTNQDPLNNTDSTQYVTQMAQFSSMEQMTNLNNTMSNFASNSLIGKGVGLNILNKSGERYTGIVRGITRFAGEEIISVEVNENGKNEIREFSKSDIETILEQPDYSIGQIGKLSSSIEMLLANSSLGKNVEVKIPKTQNLKDTDKTKEHDEDKVIGEVTEVFKENGEVKLKIKPHGKNEVVFCSVSDITRILK